MTGLDDFCKNERINYLRAGHPGLLIEALRRCQSANRPPPDWVVDELEKMTAPLADKRPGRGQRSPDEMALQYTVDYMRALMVDLLRQKRGIPVREVFQAASDEIAEMDSWERWQGSEEAIRQSYKRHRKRQLQEWREREKPAQG